jgi:hypothetical protein
MATLESDGYTTFRSALEGEIIGGLREEAFEPGQPGMRCLLDRKLVGSVATCLGKELVEAGVLPKEAVAVQAIGFDKTPSTNWKVVWHQDVMFPFSRRTCALGFDMPSIKDGVHFSRPPIDILDELLAVRLHLDRCDLTSGPLRVSPGSHRSGILKSYEIPGVLAQHGELVVFAEEGEILLMRLLLLHASSKALSVGHRRVLHFVFHSGRPIAEEWHRSIGMSARSID